MSIYTSDRFMSAKHLVIFYMAFPLNIYYSSPNNTIETICKWSQKSGSSVIKQRFHGSASGLLNMFPLNGHISKT